MAASLAFLLGAPRGRPSLHATVIHDRTDFPTAAITGRTVTEMEQEGPSAAEVRDVLTYVLTQLRKPASTHPMKKVANG